MRRVFIGLLPAWGRGTVRLLRPSAGRRPSSMGWSGRGVFLLGLLLIVVLALRPASHPAASGSTVGAAIGDLAPPLHLRDLQGRVWSPARTQGHAVALIFLASWCQGCRDELPGLVRGASLLAAHGLDLVGVDAVGESTGTVSRFARAYGIRFPLLLDPSTAAMAAFAVQALPTTVIVGADGRIRAHFEAAVTAATLLHQKTAR